MKCCLMCSCLLYTLGSENISKKIRSFVLYHILDKMNGEECFLLADVLISYCKLAPLLFTVILGWFNARLWRLNIVCCWYVSCHVICDGRVWQMRLWGLEGEMVGPGGWDSMMFQDLKLSMNTRLTILIMHHGASLQYILRFWFQNGAKIHSFRFQSWTVTSFSIHRCIV